MPKVSEVLLPELPQETSCTGPESQKSPLRAHAGERPRGRPSAPRAAAETPAHRLRGAAAHPPRGRGSRRRPLRSGLSSSPAPRLVALRHILRWRRAAVTIATSTAVASSRYPYCSTCWTAPSIASVLPDARTRGGVLGTLLLPARRHGTRSRCTPRHGSPICSRGLGGTRMWPHTALPGPSGYLVRPFLLDGVVVSGRLWAACRWRLLFGVLTQAVVGRWRPWCDMCL